MVRGSREFQPSESSSRHATSFLPGYNSVIIPAPALQAVPWGNMANYMHLWGEVRLVIRARKGPERGRVNEKTSKGNGELNFQKTLFWRA